MNITLSSNRPDLVIIPTGVVLAPNETEKQFFIGVIDNLSVDTARNVIITATYIIPSCICPASPTSLGVARDNVVVTDNDGPTLSATANPLSMEEGKTNAGILTITRNTNTAVALTVNLSHNDPTELSLPATATFPIGATSINVPITTLNDPIEDGNQQVTITVSATGFISATIWVIVTDINKPDLIITGLESLDPQLTLGEQMPFKVYIHNKGLSASARGINIIGYLSKDGSISNDDILLGNYFMDVAIRAGDTVVYGGIGALPTLPGTYYLIFKVNPNQTITELLYFNNTSAPLQITVLPNYTATAMADKDIYLIGEPVVISGSSYDLQNQKLPNKAVEIYVLTGAHRREINVVTNAQGDYTYTLQPLASEYGHFTLGASYPKLGQVTVQDEYDILGVKLNNGNFITWNMMLGDTLTGNISVRNVTQVAMANVTIRPANLPNGCQLTFDTIPLLPANGILFMTYRVIAGALTSGSEYIQIPLPIHANGSNIQQDKAYYFVKSKQGFLKASITNINVNLNPNNKKTVEFEIENIGQGSTGQVTISVPNATWVRLVSVPLISNMTPGEKKTITMEFSPTAQLPLNTPASGNIAINTTNANGISIPFSVMKVSDLTGTMAIDVINQFTYFSPGSPHVDSARVRISNYFTGQIYADGLTGPDGKFTPTNLPEGQLRIVVDKLRHKSYDGVINVSAGSNQTEVVFLEYQAISFSWDVTSTTIEDEYEIDLIMNFETNVPIPVVVITMQDTLPKLVGTQTYAFNVTLTNKGLIAANDVALDLPDDIEYEFITTYQPQDILALQSIQVPVVMRVRGSGSGARTSGDVMTEANRRLGIGREKESPIPANIVTNSILTLPSNSQSNLDQSSEFCGSEHSSQLRPDGAIGTRSNVPVPDPCTNPIKIPLAFHFNDGVEFNNLSTIDNLVNDQINALNRDYSGKNEDINNYLILNQRCASFYPLSALSTDNCIVFEVGTANYPENEPMWPNGPNLKNGDRAYTFNKYHWGTGATSKWAGYLNIFVSLNDYQGVLAQYAGRSDTPGSQTHIQNGYGIHIRPGNFGGYNRIYTAGVTFNNYIAQVNGKNGHNKDGRILVHEIGHFLGLPHLWANAANQGGCGVDDGFLDTPIQARSSSFTAEITNDSCYTQTEFTCGFPHYFFNYMDITSDERRVMFTKNQAEAMYNTALNLQFKQNITNSPTNYNQCFDIVYADYSYPCGPAVLYETTARQFRYGGRVCATNPGAVVIKNPITTTSGGNGSGNTGPGSPGGPSNGTNIGTGTSIPPITTKNEECHACAKEIQRRVLLIKQGGN